MQLRRRQVELNRAHRMQDHRRLPAEAADRDAGRMLVAVPDVDEAGEVGCDLGAMHTRLGGQPLRLSAIE